ncbi:tannase/feruloyl esterase family alpha/beta hydrolase [Paucibacter soli]|uniref:tannase/feruloyl esterase family alpha/beta hydrolase n=1 Tax=Paucibacter soli TaxID=3133433 RepID=UPI0030AF4FC3
MSQLANFAHAPVAAPALLLAALLCGCGGGAAENAAPSQQACIRLQGKTLAGARVLAAQDMAASADVPAHCQVSASMAPKLNIVLRLPVSWNGKLYYVGGGGYDGAVPPLAQSAAALGKGFATVASDGGHQASGVDASWALSDPTAARMFGSEAIPTVLPAAVEMIRAAYDAAPSRSYLEGCSNGGREALMMAQRYPLLFDGIIARAPAYNWTGLMGAYQRNAKALAAPGAMLGAAKIASLAGAVRAACDSLDGLADGIVSNPAACSFDPAQLRCPGGAEAGSGCLSDVQLALLQSWTSSAQFTTAAASYRNPGWKLTGNEDDSGAWAPWLTGNGDVRASLQYLFQDTTVKSYLARNLSIDSLLYRYDQDAAALSALAALNDATSTALGAFHARGGKLMLWHGGSDVAISPKGSAEYYQGLLTALGGQAVLDGFVRFYIAPGVNHCGGGQGADEVDLLAALDAWVVQQQAPATLLASKRFAGTPLLTRPLCVYPLYPRYIGPAKDIGAALQASNFVCAP